ncbi:hypothetical protein D3C78_534080 [compost metagenome]
MLHRLRRLFDLLAQAIDALHCRIDLLLAFAGLLLATVGRVGGLAAGARDFVGGGDHFVKGGRHHVHRFTLAPGGFGHVIGDLGRAAGGGEDLVRRLADALDQVADRREELVEPAGQLRGFVTSAYFQAAGQVAFTLSDAFQAAGNAVDRAHDELGKGGTDQGKYRRQHDGEGGDQPGQLGGSVHHFVMTDQADEVPAQLLRGPDVGHVAFAIQLDLDQALAGLGQLRIALAEAAQLLEVVRRIARVDQHAAVVFKQHQVAAFAELDLLDDLGQLLERHVDVDHATGVAELVGHGAHGADQHRVIARPVIGVGAQGLARVGHGRLVPGALARVVVGHFRVARPEGVTAVAQAVGHVGVSGMAGGEAGEEVVEFLVLFAQGNLWSICAQVLFHVVAGSADQRLGGQVVDVLADAFEEQLHGVGHLADLAAAAVDEAFAGFTAQVEDHQGGDQDHRQTGDHGEGPGQFLFYVHPRSSIFLVNVRGCCRLHRPWALEIKCYLRN